MFDCSCLASLKAECDCCCLDERVHVIHKGSFDHPLAGLRPAYVFGVCVDWNERLLCVYVGGACLSVCVLINSDEHLNLTTGKTFPDLLPGMRAVPYFIRGVKQK